MSAIRPQAGFTPSALFPAGTPPAPASSPAAASRSDFFRAALAQVQGTVAAEPKPAADTPVRSVVARAEPDRLARPGSLLDIRI